jgi:hypothetical protein
MTGQPGEVAGYWNPSNGLKLMSSIFNQSEIYDLGGAVLNITAMVTFLLENLKKTYLIDLRLHSGFHSEEENVKTGE